MAYLNRTTKQWQEIDTKHHLHPFTDYKSLAEEGSIMKSTIPAASGARGVTLLRLGDAVLGALSKAVPKRVSAANEGGPTLYSFGGYDSTKNPFIFV